MVVASKSSTLIFRLDDSTETNTFSTKTEAGVCNFVLFFLLKGTLYCFEFRMNKKLVFLLYIAALRGTIFKHFESNFLHLLNLRPLLFGIASCFNLRLYSDSNGDHILRSFTLSSISGRAFFVRSQWANVGWFAFSVNIFDGLKRVSEEPRTDLKLED
ncbi:hypothetical protein L484_004038 [Morus notabilis]|uniref:Uncharacterized protein n=1 Tax=Morus notabilis TaxID=981085 RepID=W9RAB1_9ROSA|nr:hypothetical protein L484_004038 [Morus notabilis]